MGIPAEQPFPAAPQADRAPSGARLESSGGASPTAIHHAILNYWPALAAAAFGALGAGACAAYAGPTLGMYLGPLVFATIFVPPLATIGKNRGAIAAIALGMTVGVAAVWLARNAAAQTHLDEWAACSAVLAAYCLALAGAANLLGRILSGRSRSASEERQSLSHANSAETPTPTLPPSTRGGGTKATVSSHATLGAAIIVLLGLAWLTWPIWLAPLMAGESSGRLVSILIPANPLFTLNGVLYQHLGVWAQFSLAYNLTDLGEIPYSLPSSILSSVLWQGIIGGVLIVLGTKSQSLLLRDGECDEPAHR